MFYKDGCTIASGCDLVLQDKSQPTRGSNAVMGSLSRVIANKLLLERKSFALVYSLCEACNNRGWGRG
jgi:hypothetical protein